MQTYFTEVQLNNTICLSIGNYSCKFLITLRKSFGQCIQGLKFRSLQNKSIKCRIQLSNKDIAVKLRTYQCKAYLPIVEYDFKCNITTTVLWLSHKDTQRLIHSNLTES